MMNFKTTLIIALISAYSAAFAQERVYFDENWETTTKDQMVYYRETSKQGNLILLKDYYKNGSLQFEGLASDVTPNSEVYEGKATWYFPDGKPEKIAEYVKGVPIGVSKMFDGQGRIVEDLIYNKEGRYDGRAYLYKNNDENTGYNMITEYKNSEATYTVVFDDSKKGIRSETIYKDGYESEVKYYDEKGKYIGSRTYNSKEGKYEGTIIEYYYAPMRIASIERYNKKGDLLESKSYYKNGMLKQDVKISGKNRQKITYNEEGKVIAKLDLKYNEEIKDAVAYEGEDYEFYEEGETVRHISTYHEGILISDRNYDEDGRLNTENFYKGEDKVAVNYYNTDGSLKAKLELKDGIAYNGTEIASAGEIVYKDGIVQDMKRLFENGKVQWTRHLNPEKNIYESKVYNEDGAVLYSYTRSVQEDSFNGEVLQYVKGKVSNKAVIKDNKLVSGKIRIDEDVRDVEIERKGEWIIIRQYTKAGKLFSEEKILINENPYGESYYFREESLVKNYNY
ncbi:MULTISPECIES: toxin-antitoxin system YwqK family antitoxin [Elizabethkingia]|uniref:membrane-binding protein n=1 Tax=Elizabethkingia TaxID=308865 RepID=UPI000A9B4579|nr:MULTISPECIES: membrane-binding protein [Elizabethkingia]MCL1655647.1 membrane-binding protein [Elizabethkingia miricola]